MEILNNYIHFLNSLLINQNIFIPDPFIIPTFFVIHVFLIFILLFGPEELPNIARNCSKFYRKIINLKEEKYQRSKELNKNNYQ